MGWEIEEHHAHASGERTCGGTAAGAACEDVYQRQWGESYGAGYPEMLDGDEVRVAREQEDSSMGVDAEGTVRIHLALRSTDTRLYHSSHPHTPPSPTLTSTHPHPLPLHTLTLTLTLTRYLTFLSLHPQRPTLVEGTEDARTHHQTHTATSPSVHPPSLAHLPLYRLPLHSGIWCGGAGVEERVSGIGWYVLACWCGVGTSASSPCVVDVDARVAAIATSRRRRGC